MKKFWMMGILLALSLWMTACNAMAQPPTEPVPTGETLHSTLPGVTQTLDEFSSVEIDVLAADIRIVPGKQWAVSYNLSEKEPLKRFGVEGDTLYVETTFDPKQYFDRSQDWFVTVTVPEGTALSQAELDTLSGHVSVQGVSCDDLSLSSTSGDVGVEDVTAGEVNLKSTSGNVTAAKLTADSLDAESVSGDVQVDGAFKTLETGTISGQTQVTGAISKEGTLKSTSGSINLTLSHAAAIQADSMGTITLNGNESRGHVRLQNGIPVTLHSVSGKLMIQTTK